MSSTNPSSVAVQAVNVSVCEEDSHVLSFPVSSFLGAPDLQLMSKYNFCADMATMQTCSHLFNRLFDGGPHIPIKNLSANELRTLILTEREFYSKDLPIKDIPFDKRKGYYCGKCYAVLSYYFPDLSDTERRNLTSVNTEMYAWNMHCATGLSNLKGRTREIFGKGATDLSVEFAIERSKYLSSASL